LIGAFQASYPEVRVNIFITERFVDHVAEGIDVAFRIGTLRDSSLVARKILSYRQQLLATPEYLKKGKSPEKPQDLLQHPLLGFSQQRSEISWTFNHVSGKETETLVFSPQFATNDFSGLAAAMLAGAGIGLLPPTVRPELVREGRLVEVMPEWRFRTLDLSLVHLGLRHIPRPVRVFKEFAAQMVPALFPSLPR
jgi:DNA-binding transcriptional LysR family regulator